MSAALTGLALTGLRAEGWKLGASLCEEARP